MLIGRRSRFLLKQTRAKAKMYEYEVPENLHIAIDAKANELLVLAIAAIGNISADILNAGNPYRRVPQNNKDELEFASQFFDAFLETEMEPRCPDYIALLGSIAYYLCDYIGSSIVMANKLDTHTLDIGCNGIENVLACILQNKYEKTDIEVCLKENGPYSQFLKNILDKYFEWHDGIGSEDYRELYAFRDFIHIHGTPRDFLIADALIAIILIKHERSILNLMPKYSDLSVEYWTSMLNCRNPIYELWPSQIRLGEEGVFRGKSGVIQMPTSAGKTTSLSLAIRAAFFSQRTSLAMIVAPFRALCSEIQKNISDDFSDCKDVLVNELSDVFEAEDFLELLETVKVSYHLITVLTPEKLQYLMRQNTDFIKNVGLIIFDEADMFDDTTRGTQYELLISAVKTNISDYTQCLFLSASIPNAKQINGWLTGGEGIVVSDNSVKAANRSVAVADWEEFQGENYGYLYFLDNENQDNLEFYVPRVIEIKKLNKLPREKKQQYFPEVDFSKNKVKNNDAAIYLANKLIHNGAIAIFCGRKDSADIILKRILDINIRGIDISNFARYSSQDEMRKIAYLIKLNYGEDNIFYSAASKGAFCHHRGLSNGIRVSVEYAIQHNLIRFIACTSTLAQGVNLPIKYLIVSSIYQSNKRMKVRDFHNLIGRAGRAGKHTEGTIILSEMFVYSERASIKRGWKWKNYIDTLDPSNSESCISMFDEIVRVHQIQSSVGPITYTYYPLAVTRYTEPEKYEETKQMIFGELNNNCPEELDSYKKGLENVEKSLEAIESYLLSVQTEESILDITPLASNTLGYYLSSEENRGKVIELFQSINDYILRTFQSKEKRKMTGCTLLGAQTILGLEEKVIQLKEEIIACKSTEELLTKIIDLIVTYNDNKYINAIYQKDAVLDIAISWIRGSTYEEIVALMQSRQYSIIKRKKKNNIELNDIIEICDQGFGYSSMLLINAISEILKYNVAGSVYLSQLLNSLNNRMRYGLPSKKSIIIYNNGFPDRIIALGISKILKDEPICSKQQFYYAAQFHKDELRNYIDDFPSYYKESLDKII